jgi:glutaredoxin 3
LGEHPLVVELDTFAEGKDIQQELKSLTGQSSVPSIWIKGKFMGGNSDVQAAALSGKLQELLKE